MKTLQHRYVEALTGLGYATFMRNMRKYIVMKSATTKDANYYVGTHGGIRVGVAYTRSHPLTNTWKENILLAWEMRQSSRREHIRRK